MHLVASILPLAALVFGMLVWIADLWGFGSNAHQMFKSAFELWLGLEVTPASSSEPPAWVLSATAMATLLTGAILSLWIRQSGALSALTCLAISIAGIFGAAWAVHNEFGILVQGGGGIMVLSLVAIAGLIGELISPETWGLGQNAAFGPNKGRSGRGLTFGGKTREVTALSCCISNLNDISALYVGNPGALTALVQEFIDHVSGFLTREGATIDSSTDRAIIAVWNAPSRNPDHITAACDTALKIIKEIDELNRRLEDSFEFEGLPFQPISVGIGLNTDTCTFGARKPRAPNQAGLFMGPATAQIAELSSNAARYGSAIIVTETTAAGGEDRFALLEVDKVAIGAKQSVALYALLGNPLAKANPRFRELLAHHAGFLDAYRGMDWPTARQRLEECRAMPAALEPLYALYESRLRGFEQTPPPDGWAGEHALQN